MTLPAPGISTRGKVTEIIGTPAEIFYESDIGAATIANGKCVRVINIANPDNVPMVVKVLHNFIPLCGVWDAGLASVPFSMVYMDADGNYIPLDENDSYPLGCVSQIRLIWEIPLGYITAANARVKDLLAASFLHLQIYPASWHVPSVQDAAKIQSVGQTGITINASSTRIISLLSPGTTTMTTDYAWVSHRIISIHGYSMNASTSEVLVSVTTNNVTSWLITGLPSGGSPTPGFYVYGTGKMFYDARSKSSGTIRNFTYYHTEHFAHPIKFCWWRQGTFTSLIGEPSWMWINSLTGSVAAELYVYASVHDYPLMRDAKLL